MRFLLNIFERCKIVYVQLAAFSGFLIRNANTNCITHAVYSPLNQRMLMNI